MSSRSRRVESASLRIALSMAVLALAGCGHDDAASVASAPPTEAGPEGTAVSGLFPGGGDAPALAATAAKYEGNPQAIAEGKRLFGWYNCTGCHFHGAGGIGPALMDDTWIYGDRLDQIFASIYQGRPNGMPSWRGKLSTTEIWEIAAYVKDLSARNADTPEPNAPPPATPVGAAREPNGPAPPPSPLDLPMPAHGEQPAAPPAKPIPEPPKDADAPGND